MWIRILVLICVIPGFLHANEIAGTFILKGSTWNTPAGRYQEETITIHQDSQGRVLQILNQGTNVTSDCSIEYENSECRFWFVDNTGVTIRSRLLWRKSGANSTVLTVEVESDVPETNLNGRHYPRSVQKKTRDIALRISQDGQSFEWTDGDSRFFCHPGKNLVWEIQDKENDETFQVVLDGTSSDATNQSSLKMLYSRRGDSVVGKQYWQYHPMAWVGNEAAWYQGGTIEYHGNALVADNPLDKVVNFTILSIRFGNNARTYFGPSLFGIPIR